MTSNDRVTYSPGKLVTLWRMIFLLHEYQEDVHARSLAGILKDTGMFGGTIPIQQSIEIAQICGFLDIKTGQFQLSEFAKNNVLPLCHEKEPNVAVLRVMLSSILSVNKFHWLLFFNEDIEIYKISLPNEWIDLFEGANLLNLDDPEVILWWQDLLGAFQDFDDKKKKEIGDVGEKLTIEFEKKRLVADGVDNPQFIVKWISRFRNSFGYDVLSIRGGLLKNRLDVKDPVHIEVKSSVISDEKNFIFKISRNEWKTALVLLDSYYFHCWVGINLESESAEKGPFILTAKSLIKLMPTDNSELCEWTESRLTLDLTKYSIN